MMRLARGVYVLAAIAAPLAAAGQTVINLDNLGGIGGSTTLDLNNSSIALSNGGFRGGAVSMLGQAANNQLNVLDLTGAAGGAGVAPLTGSIQVIMRAGAVATSLTTANTSGAISSGIVPIIGAPMFNLPWTGGYGGAGNVALVGGGQAGQNTINGFATVIAPGSVVSLIQQAGPLAALPLAQTASLNAAVSNTWISSTLNGGASINGTMAGGSGQQGGGISMNGALIVGSGAIDVQQIGGMSPTLVQAVNRAGAFVNNALTPSFNFR